MTIALSFVTLLFGSASVFAFIEGDTTFGIVCAIISAISFITMVVRLLIRSASGIPLDCDNDCDSIGGGSGGSSFDGGDSGGSGGDGGGGGGGD